MNAPKTSTLRNSTINQEIFASTSDYEAQLPSLEEIKADYHFYTAYRRLEIQKALENPAESDLEVRHFLREELGLIARAEKETE